MKIDRNFVLREIAGEYIIIPTGKTALEFNGLITVNEIGMELWRLIELDVNMFFLLLQDSVMCESGLETLRKKRLSKYLSVRK